MHFVLIQNHSPAEFAAEVNNMLARGYKFHGEMQTIAEQDKSSSSFRVRYIQGMYCEE